MLPKKVGFLKQQIEAASSRSYADLRSRHTADHGALFERVELHLDDTAPADRPTDVELSDTISSVLKQVDSLTPHRVVFDSLSELRMLARDPLRYRRQILGLKRYFAGRKCTVLPLDDRTAEGNDLQLQSIAHGVVASADGSLACGSARRST